VKLLPAHEERLVLSIAKANIAAHKEGLLLPGMIEAFLFSVTRLYPDQRIRLTVTPRPKGKG
jgi:hypothetical protein